jgi:glycosyltransferase involved in cell wall biosynthesis
MRVLMQGRPDLLTRIGGDTIQALKTGEYLRQLGVRVDVSSEAAPALDRYDLTHLFNCTGVTHIRAQMENAHAQGKPVALSTIYWNQDELLTARLEFGTVRWLRRLLGKQMGGWVRQRIWYAQAHWREQVALMREADLLLPNSRAEAALLRRDFRLRRAARVSVIVNGIDAETQPDVLPQSFGERFGVRDFILSIGRIEIRKNQLALLQVLRPDDPPVVFVGTPNGSEPIYAARVFELAHAKNVHIIEALPHADIASAYSAACMHVMPSWYETPGLASMEAAITGCPIVTTDRGCPREYFDAYAEYCDPANPHSLRRALDRTLAKPHDDRLRNHLLAHFTWDIAARQTLAAYQTLL